MESIQFKRKAKLYILSGQVSDLAVSCFEKGCAISGITDGGFSLLSLIHSVLKKTGEANIVISTWSAGLYEITALKELLDSRLALSVKILIDRSFKTRQKGYAHTLEECFGIENIVSTNTHAKFVIIKNSEYSVVIRSSMNLNENKRCENFDIDEGGEIYDFFIGFVDVFFEKTQQKGCIESRSVVDHVFDDVFNRKTNTKAIETGFGDMQIDGF